ncbi:cobyric acid synthase [Kiloniella sp. b19]|uniref:cobyric acid synthase n=1 Tax=Kiloniella sp. GXU_MW_B19 TaxID=3141326 RepID=UPI0031E438E2
MDETTSETVPYERSFPAIMFQGTGSDVGKSLLVAGFARAYSRKGLKVRPFKPQNMSNNAAVTEDGGEIGRAQALQARACGVRPNTDMNPVLLKPQSDYGSQVIVQGKIWGNTGGGAYWKTRKNLMPRVLESFERLGQEADLVLVEGAGSPAEANLRSGDIANMGFAEAADVPVVLVGDIDRGGVIASLIGTREVLSESERERVAGYLINKFRGDVALFESGLDIITDRTAFPSLGVIPFFKRARLLPDEDAVSVQDRKTQKLNEGAKIRIAVPLISRISNFDDFDPLIAEPEVELRFIHPGEVIPAETDMVILPGSKATLADLAFFRAQGWDVDLMAHIRRGGHVFGICGGYQMMGELLSDPIGIEGEPSTVTGLGLLPVETELTATKTLIEVCGTDRISGIGLHGYEMHVGETRLLREGESRASALLQLGDRAEGVYIEEGRIAGCYLHGLFSDDSFRAVFLSRIRSEEVVSVNFEALIDQVLDELADHLEEHCDLDGMLEAATRGVKT